MWSLMLIMGYQLFMPTCVLFVVIISGNAYKECRMIALEYVAEEDSVLVWIVPKVCDDKEVATVVDVIFYERNEDCRNKKLKIARAIIAVSKNS